MHGRDSQFFGRARRNLIRIAAVLTVALTLVSGVMGASVGIADAETLCSPTSFQLDEPGRNVEFLAIFTASQGPTAIEVVTDHPLVSIVGAPDPAGNVTGDGDWSPDWNSIITVNLAAELADGSYAVTVRTDGGDVVCSVDVTVGAFIVGDDDPILILPPTTLPAVVEPAEDATEGAASVDVTSEDVLGPGEVARPGGRSLFDGAVEDLAIVGRIMLMILAAGLIFTVGLWAIRRVMTGIRDREPDGWDDPTPHVAGRLDRPSQGVSLLEVDRPPRANVQVVPDLPDSTPDSSPDEDVEVADDPLAIHDLWNMDTYEPERLSDRVSAVTTLPLDRTPRSALPRPTRRSRRSALRRLAQMRIVGGGRTRIKGPSFGQRLRLSRLGRWFSRVTLRRRIKGPSPLGRVRNLIAREQRRAAPRWERSEPLAEVVDVTEVTRGPVVLADPFEEKIG